MKTFDLNKFVGGWFVGDFAPSAYSTKDVEVAFKFHEKGSPYAPHVHRETTEINLLVSGRMKICGLIVESGTVFVINKFEVSAPEFLEDCQVVVVRIPSIPGDKYEV